MDNTEHLLDALSTAIKATYEVHYSPELVSVGDGRTVLRTFHWGEDQEAYGVYVEDAVSGDILHFYPAEDRNDLYYIFARLFHYADNGGIFKGTWPDSLSDI